MQKFIKEFKIFAFKGNMIDLAIGMIIGSAFTGLVNSVVNDLVMPLIGVITGGIDFTNLFIQLAESDVAIATLADAKAANIPVFAYGSFITQLIKFLILAVVIFFIVKLLNKLRAAHEAPATEVPAAPTTKICPYCKSEINIEASRCPNCTSELL